MAAKIQEQVEEQTSQTQPEQSNSATKQPLDWKLIIVTGLMMGAGWTVLYASGTTLSFLAGVVPIFAGFYLGRRIKHRTIPHSSLTALVGMLLTLGLLALIFLTGAITLTDQDGVPVSGWIAFTQGAFGALIVFPFAIYGAFISQRTKQQREQQAAVRKQRGGRLENPGRVRDVEDLRGLPLTKFASYVIRVFKKNGFTLEDYAFNNKESLVDIYMSHEEERWLLRCTVADKVKPGVVQELAQKMRSEEVKKGVVLTSTEYTDNALRWANSRDNLVAVDGETLWQMSQS